MQALRPDERELPVPGVEASASVHGRSGSLTGLRVSGHICQTE